MVRPRWPRRAPRLPLPHRWLLPPPWWPGPRPQHPLPPQPKRDSSVGSRAFLAPNRQQSNLLRRSWCHPPLARPARAKNAPTAAVKVVATDGVVVAAVPRAVARGKATATDVAAKAARWKAEAKAGSKPAARAAVKDGATHEAKAAAANREAKAAQKVAAKTGAKAATAVKAVVRAAGTRHRWNPVAFQPPRCPWAHRLLRARPLIRPKGNAASAARVETTDAARVASKARRAIPAPRAQTLQLPKWAWTPPRTLLGREKVTEMPAQRATGATATATVTAVIAVNARLAKRMHRPRRVRMRMRR